MALLEILLNPNLNKGLCEALSFEDAIRLQNLLKPEQVLPCIIQVPDRTGRIYNFRGVNPNTIQAYHLIRFQDAEKLFIDAAKIGQAEIIRLLLGIGIDINTKSKKEGVHSYDPEEGSTALIFASKKGYLEIVKLLLEHGAKVGIADVGNGTALLYASSDGYVETIKLLIKHGTNPNVHLADITPLILASQWGHSGVIRILLENGANINTIDDWGASALLYAARGGYAKNYARGEYEKSVEILLRYKPDVNIIDEDGNTALIYASEKGNIKIIKLLLEHGAKVDIINLEGNSALTLALRRDHKEVVELLKSYGAV